MIDENHNRLSIRKQCNLLSLSRSGFYATRNRKPSKENLELMQLLDQKYTKHPSLGSRRLRALLRRDGRRVNRKRVQRLMRLMGIAGVAPKPNLSRPAPGHKVFPYLLRNVPIERVDQVWSSDITYIPLPDGFMYLVAVIDWRSRYVLSWELSNSLDRSFCVEALRNALRRGTPEIFNTDQGSQYTAEEFTGILKERGIRISMDGRGRALDNVFIERFWRSLKYENVYIRGYETVAELYRGLVRYFHWYNEERPHQALENRTPGEVYRESRSKKPGAASVPLFPPLRRVEPILAAGVPSAAEGACRPHKKQGSPTP